MGGNCGGNVDCARASRRLDAGQHGAGEQWLTAAEPRTCLSSVSDTEDRLVRTYKHMYNAGIESCRLYFLLTIKEVKYISDHTLINEHFKTM